VQRVAQLNQCGSSMLELEARTVAAENDIWLSVIAKSLAFMCLRQAERDDAKRFDGVLARVKFLENLGLPQRAAAEAAGSSAASVTELRRVEKRKKVGGKRRDSSKGKRR
jgi:hypothetical protein